jgi:L-alanine-DL-glutamate epimerase-like enolase superfamily enzyme
VYTNHQISGSAFCWLIPVHLRRNRERRSWLERSGVWGHIEVVATAVSRFDEYLVGRLAFDTKHHWNFMHRFSYFPGMAINTAISDIDIAL